MNPEMRPIPGFTDYFVTRDGQIWKSYGRHLKSQKMKRGGYLRVTLSVNGIKNCILVHRLVLEAFVGPCPTGMEACHNNGDPSDNRLENLRWDTHLENMKDAVKQGTMKGEIHSRALLTDDKVRAMRYLRNVAKFSLDDLAWQFDVSMAQIWRICNGEAWSHIRPGVNIPLWGYTLQGENHGPR